MAEPRAHTRLLLPALLTGTFMGFLDLFIVTVALPAIRSDLRTTEPASQWILGAYVIAYGMTLVMGGRLGDRIGRRTMFVAGMIGFTASSALCSLAADISVLIAARALQGLSAAAMLPQVLATIQAAIPPEHRSRAIGAYGAVIGAASVCGQLAGGLLLQANLFGLGWRALFLINLPIGVIATGLALRVVPNTRATQAATLDVRGVLGMSIAVLALLVGLSDGPDRHWPIWTLAAIAVGLCATVVVARVEQAVQAHGGVPLVPPRLISHRAVRLGLGLVLAFYASNTGFFVVLTFFLQTGLGVSPLAAGLAFAPIGIGFSAASILGRTRERLQTPAAMAVGAAMMVAGLSAAAALASAGVGAAGLVPALAMCGLGQGIVAPPLIGVVLRRVPADEAGAASGLLLTMTQIANASGIAIVGAAWTATASLGSRSSFAISTSVALALAAVSGLTALALKERPHGRHQPVDAVGQTS
jgi:EmrB/QacA subfamily drug resistance transporter